MPSSSAPPRAWPSAGQPSCPVWRRRPPRGLAQSPASCSCSWTTCLTASSITGQTFKLFKNGSTTKIGAKVGYGASTATLDPTNSLQAGVTYKAVVSTGAKDAAGNPLAQQYRWFFTVR